MVENISEYLNDISLRNVAGLSSYAVIRINLAFFLTIIILYYNYYCYCESRARKNESYIWIITTVMVANIIFSLTATAVDGIAVLLKKWYGGEAMCQWIKILQSFSLKVTSMVIVLVLVTDVPSDTLKTRIYLFFFIICSAIFSLSEIMAYNCFQKLSENEQYTCSSYGLFTGNEAYSLAVLSFFVVPVVFLCFPFTVPNTDSPRLREIDLGGNYIRHRRRREHAKTSSTCSPSTWLKIYLRKNTCMTLYMKCLIVSLVLIFWSIHHSINIAAFIKPKAALNQFNNASILIFGSMISLLSPLVLKVFAKKSLKLPAIEITSAECQESTEELRRSAASEEYRKIDSSEDFGESINCSEFSKTAASDEFSESVASGEVSGNVTFEKIRVRDMRRIASYPLDITNVNKIVLRENFDSEEFTENVYSVEFTESVDSEEFRKSDASGEFCEDNEIQERYIRSIRRLYYNYTGEHTFC